MGTAGGKGADDPKADVDVTIATARGVELRATVNAPAKSNGVAVVLAPGRGYHRKLPLLERSAVGLAGAGFRVVRFDWAYFTAQAEPSEDLGTEGADLEAALAYARAMPDVKKVILGGKSLGTMVALAHTAKKADDLTGLLLLTFPLPTADDSAARQDGLKALAALRVPTLILCGDHDPLCDLRTLYGAVARANLPPRIVITPGDHGLAKSPEDPSETDDNIRLAVEAVVLWARRFAGV